MNQKEPNVSDQILDLLLDALKERQLARESEPDRAPAAEIEELPPPPAEAALEPPALSMPEAALPAAPLEPELPDDEDFEEAAVVAAVDLPPEPLPSVHLDRMLFRLFLILIGLVIIVNIPFDRYGTNLARAMPDSAALIIRDGLLLKGSGEKVYVLQDNQRRWISTLDAFEEYQYQWSQVHEVEDSFLDDFEEGPPIHLLLKCTASPHIYALEAGNKRWIKDIPTFEAQLYVWEDVRFVSCDYLRRLPDGPPIPEDAGPPPQP